MKVDLLTLVKNAKIFSALNDKAIKKILSQSKKVHLKKNDCLFKQGDFSTDLYVLICGKLVVTVKPDRNPIKFIREILPGDTAGELGAISHEPRSATIKALEKSILLRITYENFRDLCAEYPSVIFRILDILTERSRNLIQHISSDKPERKHIAILPANKKVSIAQFTEKMQTMLKDIPGIAFISDYDRVLRKETQKTFREHVEELSSQNNFIFYLLALHKTDLAKICLSKVDMIYVIGSGDSNAYLNDYTRKIIHDDEFTYKAKPELILLHSKKKKFPHQAAAWLKLGKFGFNHHVRYAQDADWQRIIRFMTGKAIGVVLGGGGIRSWAHIGAIKAILESGFPIDAIGGSSAGAIVGGYYALNETYEDARQQLQELSVATNRSIAVTNLTYPAVSFFNGKDYTEKQKDMFGSIKIENLWLPFFCVTCNLSRNTQVVHRRGYLWRKIRASTAVPGIFPPVVIHNKIHVDGGIINNLPVDVMKNITNSFSMIIAVQLIHHDVDDTNYTFPPILPFTVTVLSKLHIAYKNYKFPPFVDTFLRALLVGSSVKQRENSLMADILVAPDLSDYSLLKIDKNQETEIMEIGYKTTIKAIKKWHSKQAIKK